MSFTNIGAEKPNAGVAGWGIDEFSSNLELFDAAVSSVYAASLSGATTTLTFDLDGNIDNAHATFLNLKPTGGAGGSPNIHTLTISPNTVEKIYYVRNRSKTYQLTITQGSGGDVTIEENSSMIIYCDGAGAGAEVIDLSSELTTTDSINEASRKEIFIPWHKLKFGTSRSPIPINYYFGSSYKVANFLRFSYWTNYYAQHHLVMPSDWDGEAPKFKFAWTPGEDGETGDVVWGARTSITGDGEPIDEGWGTAKTSTQTTNGVEEYWMVTGETDAVAPKGQLNKESVLSFQVYLDSSSTVKNYQGLLGVYLIYNHSD